MTHLFSQKILLRVALCGVMACAGAVSFSAPRQETKPEAVEKPANKPQESVASKKAFAAVKSTDEAVKKALGAKDLEGAAKLVGKEGAFTGTVTRIYTAKGNSLILLNFDEQYKTALTAKLGAESYAKFPVMKDLVGKKILVKGTFVLYRKKAEIELTDPAQIKIIEK